MIIKLSVKMASLVFTNIVYSVLSSITSSIKDERISVAKERGSNEETTV